MNVVGITSRAQVQEMDQASKLPKGIEYINVYDESPTVEMSLDQFEIYALKRLKVFFARFLLEVFQTQDIVSSRFTASGPEKIGTFHHF